MNFHIKSFHLLSLALFCSIGAGIISCSRTTRTNSKKVEMISQMMSAYSKHDQHGKFNGSILVAEKGEIIYQNAFGLANVELNIENTIATKFRIASITKQFTAALILRLHEEDQLDLNTPISNYLPNYPIESGSLITIHHLLNHSSGIPNQKNLDSLKRFEHSVEELVESFSSLVLEFKPGESFAYSNSGYLLLGHIIEQISGKSYVEYLKEQILNPLEMNSSGMEDSKSVLKNIASGYTSELGQLSQADYINMSVPFSAGSMYSSVEDLNKWNQALYTDQILNKNSRELMFENQIPTHNGHYGYGWFIVDLPLGNTNKTVKAIQHSGNIDGFNSLIVRIPSQEQCIILLNNTGRVRLNRISIGIAGILNGEDYETPKKSLAKTLVTNISENGLEQALIDYEKARVGYDHYLDEDEMNLTGYQFLKDGQIEAAKAVFALNTQSFPYSFNVYDSYGEALLESGDTAKAALNFKKSLEINPGNDNAIQQMEKLGHKKSDLVYQEAIENLRPLIGRYKAIRPKEENRKDWYIEVIEKDGELNGIDRDYQYRMVPVKKDQFVNPEDGEKLNFNTEDSKAISFIIFGNVKFEKVE